MAFPIRLHSHLVCLLGLLAILPGCGPKQSGAETRPPIVYVEKPLEKEVIDYAFFTGRTDGIESVDVRSRVTGYLDAIDFESGKEVKKDQKLFKIDPRPYKAALDQANGQVLVADAQLKLAEADYRRAQALARTSGAISAQEVDKYLAAQGQAQAQLKAAIANSETAKLNLEFTDIYSPIDGIVSRNLLTRGNLVLADSTLLTTVVRVDEMYGYFDVDERTMLKFQELIRQGKETSVRDGGKILVDFGLINEGDEYPHHGYLEYVNNQLDTSTGTISVRAILENPKLGGTGPRLLTSGLFLRYRVPLGKPAKGLLVPQAAIQSDLGQKFLLIVNKENKVEKRLINAGPLQPKGLQVIEPIKPTRNESGNEQAPGSKQENYEITAETLVIVSGLQMASPGSTVEPKPYKKSE
jgi:multidrug efflux system membrane fusion protein